MNDIIVGIDLGTTNSEVAILKNGQVTVIEDANSKILPSVVGITDTNELLVGTSAKNQQLLFPESTISSIKRKMGTDEKITLGDQSYSPQEISAIILKQLKLIAENHINQSVSKAVITVPAYFSDQQRQATREAGQIAGLDVVRIINEPTAAALAYNTDQQDEKKVLVYDLGGGTFDVSIVSIASGVVEVISSHGNNHLGGDDFDQKIVDHLVNYIQEEFKVDVSNNIKTMTKIKRAAEKAKIHLSDHTYCKIDEEYLFEQDGNSKHLSLELSRDDYEQMIQGYIDETMEAVHTALDDVNLTTQDIDEVLLVGGSTRTPLVEETLSSVFSNRPHGEIHPDLCVATGAAIQAGTIVGEKASAVLVDITPYTFGTSAIGVLDDMMTPDLYVPIINKNSPIPVTKSKVFTKFHEHQDTIEINVYQGEEKHASDNNKIGDFRLTGLSKKAGQEEIIAKFHLDVNGILHVTAEEKVTGKSRSITISNVLQQTSSEQDSENKIIHLFKNTEASSIDDAEQESNNDNEVDIALEKANVLLDTVSDADKVDLIDLIEDVKDAQKSNNSDKLQQAVEQLNDLMFYLEESPA